MNKENCKRVLKDNERQMKKLRSDAADIRDKIIPLEMRLCQIQADIEHVKSISVAIKGALKLEARDEN